MTSTPNLQNALKVLINTSMTLDNALEDKRITPLEWAQIAIKSISFWKVIKNIEPIKLEMKTLTDQSRTELQQWVEEEFDLRNENLEKQIELIFAALISLSEITLSRKKLLLK
jgi:hypothetical protein